MFHLPRLVVRRLGDAATAMANAEVTRQAAMVAYIDDFYLMMWLSLLSVPLVLFMRKNTIHSAPLSGSFDLQPLKVLTPWPGSG